MGKRLLTCLALCAAVYSQETFAAAIGPNVTYGTVTAISSGPGFLLVQLDNNAAGIYPSNCVNPAGWFYINQQYQAMTALFLSSYFAGRRTMFFYVDSSTSGQFCPVNQIQPVL